MEFGNDAMLFMGAYLAVMLALGVLGRARRREESLRDFYLGGSAFGFVVLFLTFFATQYSGNTLLGFAGRAYRSGASYVVSVTFMILAITVIVSYGPRLYRLARRFGYITPADYVFHRFGSHRLRVMCVVLLSWGLANYILEQLVAMGRGSEALSNGKLTAILVSAARELGLSSLVQDVPNGGLDFMGGVLILVFVMLLYESLGGMRAVAWTDVVQGTLLLCGCACIFYLVFTNEGGLRSATATIARSAPEKIALPDGAGLRNWLSTLILLGFGVSVYPHAIQRIFAARNLPTLRRSLGVMAFMPLLTTLLAFLLGYVGLSRFPGLAGGDPDKITIYVLSSLGDSVFVRWLVVVMLTAVLAAIMSTADSALLSIGSMFTKDIYQVHFRPNQTAQHYLRVGKWLGWGLMVVLILSAYASLKTESSIWLLIKLKLEFMVQIAPVFVLGIFWPRMTEPAAFWGMATGTAITVVVWVGAVAGLWDTRSPWDISAGVWGLAANFAICLLGSRPTDALPLRVPVAAGTTSAVLALALLLLPSGARAQCQPDDQCRFKKPNILVVLDYSSSMVGFEGNPAYFPAGQAVTTRWDAQLDAVKWILRYDDGFFADNARIGLARFAHDPRTAAAGTVIASDRSFPPITDGFAIDVPFDGSDGGFLECRNSGVDAEVELLRTTPPPWIRSGFDATQIMLTWTRGALSSAHELIRRTRDNHAADPAEAERVYEVVLMTDGDWTCPDMIGQSCSEDPAPEAAVLRQDGIRTHVVAFGDATMQPSLNEVALQGGTASAIDATSPQGIVDALTEVLDDIRGKVIVPECTRGLPRILLIMDGSSSMIEGAAAGETKWDKARFALTGNPAAPNPADAGYVEPIFTREIEIDGRTVAIEDVVHLGLMTFSTADRQVLLAGFGPCMRDNVAWAMDPATSCQAPGCSDPYAGYPIEWTERQSGADGAPAFVRPTRSYMPACNETQGSTSCVGEVPNTFTGEGLAFARQLIEDYKQNPSPFHADDATRFVNILITDGQTSEGSSGVQTALQAMAEEGIDTYVIGFGSDAELDAAELAQYATWGSTGSAITVDPAAGDSASALADALEGIVSGLDLDACCVLNDCSVEAEPADPAPVCGDGRVEGEEHCDDGARNANYGACSARCDGPHLYCGDGRVDPPEQCDGDDNPRCNRSCLLNDDDAGNDFTGSGGAPPVPPRPVRDASAGPLPILDAGDRMDAAPGGDAAAAAPQPKDGCGCRASAGSTRWGGASALLAVSALLGARRRRQRVARGSKRHLP